MGLKWFVGCPQYRFKVILYPNSKQQRVNSLPEQQSTFHEGVGVRLVKSQWVAVVRVHLAIFWRPLQFNRSLRLTVEDTHHTSRVDTCQTWATRSAGASLPRP